MTSKQRTIGQLSDCAITSTKQSLVAIYQGQAIDHDQFNADVCQLASSLSKLEHEFFALYYEQGYSFCVSLFALLHSNKKIWIAANNRPVTAEQLIKQSCLLLGDWNGKETLINPVDDNGFELTPLNLNDAVLTIFTSGSSGQAKAINKTLQQFQSEIETLENAWGDLLKDAQIFATVSHQHIYGLLFRILWPLAAGRCFQSEMFLSPEPLLKSVDDVSAYWVASPAQLKRLDELTPWSSLAKLKVIFSSGGALSIEASKQIYQQSKHKVFEIYGSSETGGIAWRQSIDTPLWTTFENIYISVNEQGQSFLSSPFLIGQQPYKMDDNIKLMENCQFELLGRLDRIVKIEEKRLSLDELELTINTIDGVESCHTLLMSDKRDKIAAVLALSQNGYELLKQQGRAAFIKLIRKQLMARFESVVLPKKWLFMATLPTTSQGKVDRELLLNLLSLDRQRAPQIVYCDFQQQTVDLHCRILPSLVYFDGHFPEQPVLPGVTQLAWAERLAKLFFTIDAPFLRMEVVKFKKIIQPEEVITITLTWKPDNNKLYFEMNSEQYAHSSGRIVYGEQP